MPFTIDQLVIFAAGSGNLPLLQERVAAGGNVNHVDATHGTALSAAIRSQRLGVVQWLLENGADANVESEAGLGPLELALHNPVPEIVECLMNCGANLRKKTRPHYAERRDQCLKDLAARRKQEAG